MVGGLSFIRNSTRFIIWEVRPFNILCHIFYNCAYKSFSIWFDFKCIVAYHLQPWSFHEFGILMNLSFTSSILFGWNDCILLPISLTWFRWIKMLRFTRFGSSVLLLSAVAIVRSPPFCLDPLRVSSICLPWSDWVRIESHGCKSLRHLRVFTRAALPLQW
jgi:hypothetical protein